jgi:Fe-S cluster assembly protein SufD
MSGLTTNKMSTIVENSLFGQLTSTFQELELTNEPSSLKALRQEAFAKFEREGFPTIKNEEWKYTNIQHLVNKTYLLNEDVDVADLDLSKANIPNLDAHQVVLVNGQYVLAFSSLEDEVGVTVKPIEEAVEEVGFQKHFAQQHRFVYFGNLSFRWKKQSSFQTHSCYTRRDRSA